MSLAIMEQTICQNFNKHFSIIQAAHTALINNQDAPIPENILDAIRVLLSSVTLARKHNIRVDAPPDFLSVVCGLLQHQKISIDLIILTSRLESLARAHFYGASFEDLFSVYHQKTGFQQLCLLFGLVDCLPYANSQQNDAAIFVGKEILKLLKLFTTNYYYKLKLLHAWLLAVKSLVAKQFSTPLARNELFLPHSEFVEFLNLHWETPMCQDLPAQCISALCEVWRTAQPNSQYADIVAKTTLTNLAWTSKTKFLILAALLPYTHFTEVLCEYPDAIYSMTSSLDSNYLLPGGALLFKALSKTLKEQEWQDYCEGVLLDALNHSNRVVRLNAVQYWLPCILHTSPKVVSEFKERLNDLENFNWLAYISLLKMVGQLDARDRILANKALYHGEEEVRVAAFGLLCHSIKRTEPPSPDEWILVQDFIPDNLHSDNAQFRSRILSVLRVFLIRVLESCLHRLNKNDAVKASIQTDVEHVRRLHDRLITTCLHHGAGYQRKVAGLTALRYILQLFGNNDSQAESLVKGASSIPKRALLVQLASEYWNWTGPSSLDRYTICLLDKFPEVRLKAAEILKDFFSSGPAITTGNYLSTIYHCALELCDSPKFPLSECGATVMQLLTRWGSGPTVEFLLDGIQERFQRLQLNWMIAAERAPIHGFLGALVQILQVPQSRADFAKFYPRIIQLACTISNYMLDTLASQSASSDVAPSFEEMSQAIDNIVRRHHPSQNLVDTVSITTQQQIVLACAWLNLKESGNLAVQVAFMLLNDNQLTLSEVERRSRIEECVRVVYQILLRCRHKGAIEAASESMGLLCRHLFASKIESIRTIPRNALLEFLNRLESTQSGASVTRRSAGLVFLVVKIVSSEPGEKSSKDSLMYLAVQRLISIAQRPVTESVEAGAESDGSCDLPQALAMHLLKGLVHDASLSTALLHPELMEPIFRLSIELFDHPHWAIRNAALQLHGSAIPRLAGPHFNKTTAELFHKFPGLEEFFLNKLIQRNNSEELVGSGLIPSLSLLCRLAPSNDPVSRNETFSSRLTHLLAHPVSQVRTMAARSLLAFMPLYKTKWKTILLCDETISLTSDASNSGQTNRLHGQLLVLQEFLGRCRAVALSVEDWQTIREAVSALSGIEQTQPCYYVKLAVLQLFKQLGMAGNVDFFKQQLEGGEVVRRQLHQQPGFSDWLRLKTELVSNHISLNHMLTAIDHLLPFSNGLDVVEPALQVLKDRLVRLSSSSILANTVTGFVTHYIGAWETFPSLMPVCLDFVQARGVGALMERGDTSFRWYANFFLGKCIESRQLGTATALSAIPAASAVIKEALQKSLVLGADDLVTRLTRALLEASKPEESLDFRLAAARSLKATGRVLLEIPGKGQEAERNLFLLILNLVQDEERNIRQEAASFLTEILLPSAFAEDRTPQLDVMSTQRCQVELAGQIRRWFQPAHLIPVILELLSDSDVRSGSHQEDVQLLYEPEAHNFFREETECVSFLVRVAQSLSESTGPLVELDVLPLLEDADRLLNLAEAGRMNEAGWLFTRSVESINGLVRLSARLRIIALCYPSWRMNQHFAQLQLRLELLNLSM